jgi:hypothetical protein
MANHFQMTIAERINEHATYCQECRPPEHYCETMKKLVAELLLSQASAESQKGRVSTREKP